MTMFWHTKETHHGLRNQGSTCYLNSVLQVLFMTDRFRWTIARAKKDSEHIDKELRDLFTKLEETTAETKAITRKLNIRNVREQRDAAEHYEKILRLTSPRASETFHGKLMNSNKCLKCAKTTGSEAAFWSLPLPLVSSSSPYSVNEGIADFFRKSTISGADQMYCEDCDEKQDAELLCKVSHLPFVLALLLKRFEFDYNTMTYVKDKQPVNVPLTVQISGGSAAQSYRLYAFVEHFGELGCGHYTSTCLSRNDGKWYIFNDSHVSQLCSSPSLEGSTSAYLLFYQKQPKRKWPFDDGEAGNTAAAKKPKLEVQPLGQTGRESPGGDLDCERPDPSESEASPADDSSASAAGQAFMKYCESENYGLGRFDFNVILGVPAAREGHAEQNQGKVCDTILFGGGGGREGLCDAELKRQERQEAGEIREEGSGERFQRQDAEHQTDGAHTAEVKAEFSCGSAKEVESESSQFSLNLHDAFYDKCKPTDPPESEAFGLEEFNRGENGEFDLRSERSLITEVHRDQEERQDGSRVKSEADRVSLGDGGVRAQPGPSLNQLHEQSGADQDTVHASEETGQTPAAHHNCPNKKSSDKSDAEGEIETDGWAWVQGVSESFGGTEDEDVSVGCVDEELNPRFSISTKQTDCKRSPITTHDDGAEARRGRPQRVERARATVSDTTGSEREASKGTPADRKAYPPRYALYLDSLRHPIEREPTHQTSRKSPDRQALGVSGCSSSPNDQEKSRYNRPGPSEPGRSCTDDGGGSNSRTLTNARGSEGGGRERLDFGADCGTRRKDGQVSKVKEARVGDSEQNEGGSGEKSDESCCERDGGREGRAPRGGRGTAEAGETSEGGVGDRTQRQDVHNSLEHHTCNPQTAEVKEFRDTNGGFELRSERSLITEVQRDQEERQDRSGVKSGVDRVSLGDSGVRPGHEQSGADQDTVRASEETAQTPAAHHNCPNKKSESEIETDGGVSKCGQVQEVSESFGRTEEEDVGVGCVDEEISPCFSISTKQTDAKCSQTESGQSSGSREVEEGEGHGQRSAGPPRGRLGDVFECCELILGEREDVLKLTLKRRQKDEQRGVRGEREHQADTLSRGVHTLTLSKQEAVGLETNKTL